MPLPALMKSKWIANGGPSICAHCSQPFPYSGDGHSIQAQVGKDRQLYCYGTTCADDAALAAIQRRGRLL
jgi:hypothetical protein